MSSNHCQQPVFDSHPPELYGSHGAEASQRYVGSFLQAESLAPQVEEGKSPEGSQNTSTYMSLRNQEREPSNEYDYIPGDPTLEPRLAIAPPPPTETRGQGGTLEKKRRQEPADSGTSSGDGGRCTRKVTENSMYENHDIKPLLHPTLTGRDEGMEGVAVREGERCSCSTKSLVQAFFLAMTLLLAIASLGLSGLMWFGVNDNESPTDTTSLPVEMTGCSCPVSIHLLREELEELRSALEDMNTSILEVEAQLTIETNTLLPVVLDRVEDLTSDVVNITQLFNSEPPVDVLLNVSHIYGRCETTIKSSCSLPLTSALNNCTTDFVLTNSSESYVLVLYSVCRTRQLSITADYTAVLASLEVRDEDEAVRCSCLRLGEPTVARDCELAVTSCPILWDLSSGSRVVV